MLRKNKRSPRFYRYTILYFLALALASGAVSVLMLRHSMDQLVQAERENALENMTIMADDLEEQYQALMDLSIMISIDPNYQPSFLATSRYKDIELLRSFPYFVNYSALSKQYFLMYPGERRIFTSSGSSAYFEYYAPSVLQISQGEALALGEELLLAQQPLIRRFQQRFLAVFPIRFSNGGDAAGRAVLCFILTPNQILQRIHHAGTGRYQDMRVLISDTEMVGFSGKTGKAPALSAASANGRVQIHAVLDYSGVLRAYTQRPWRQAFSILGCLAAVLLAAYALSYLSLHPLWRLIRHYRPGGRDAIDEIHQLETILSQMEEISNQSLEQMRNTLLVSILRGYCSEDMLSKWQSFHISFERGRCSVLLMDAAFCPEGEAWAIMRQLESAEDAHYHLYAAYIADDRNIAVLADFDSTITVPWLIAMLRQRLNRPEAIIHGGEIFESPKLLSISYMQALTARSYEYLEGKTGASGLERSAHRLAGCVRARNAQGIAEECALLAALLKEKTRNTDELKQALHGFLFELRNAMEKQSLQNIDMKTLQTLYLLPDADTFACELSILLCAAADAMPPCQSEQSSQRISHAIVEYVVANVYDPDLSLGQISDKFGLSEDYISTMIKKETGAAFKEYLTKLRIEQVKHLLLTHPEMTVNEIAEQVGYRSVSNLIKKFKEITGCTPTQFR